MDDPRAATRGYYDAVAARSFAEWFDNETLLPTLRAFAAGLAGDRPAPPRVLDLGCGTGGESKRLAALGTRVTGVDFSHESIELARAHVPGVEFIEADLLDLDFPAASFEGAVEAGVLFHLAAREQDALLGRLRAWLAPGGRFLSYYPRGDFEGMQEMPVEGGTGARYARWIPGDAWRAQVEAAGFAFVRQLPFDLGRFECREFER